MAKPSHFIAGRQSSWAGILLVVFLIVVAVLAVYLIRPPAAVPVSAEADQYSAVRAFEHINTIAREPHPIGSSANAAVRDYLLGELAGLGLEGQVQDTTVVYAPYAVAGRVHNVLARMPGTGELGERTRAILLAAHYDSVPSGPGASDDASGVATLLEAARALRAGPPLKNDIILLFTDGEEIGLAGAQAFADKHPWAGDVGLALNFEARGHTGPVFMFETNPQNGWLISEFARAAPYPLGNSLLYEVYQTLPNDTDFTVFKAAGWPGFNFSFIGGVTHYHSLLDNPANLDLRSLQHNGTHAMGLVQHFGNLDLTDPFRPDVVYFDIMGRWVLHYPAGWALPLALLAGLLFAGVAWVGFRKGLLSWGGIAAGFLALLLNVALAVGATWLAYRLVVAFHPAYYTRGDTYNSLWLFLGFCSLTLALAAALFVGSSRLLQRRMGCTPDQCSAGLGLGALLWWLVLGVAGSLLLPMVSFLFVWPVLPVLLGFLLWFALPAGRGGVWLRAGVLALSAVPVLLLLMPFVYNFYIGLTIQAILIPMAILAFFLGLFYLHLDLATRSSSWVLPALAGLCALVFLGTGGLSARYDAARPRQNMIVYGLDADGQTARWIGFADPDEWTGQFLPPGQVRPAEVADILPDSSGVFPVSSAPVLPLEGPQVALLEDTRRDGLRTLRLQVTSPRGAPVVRLYVTNGNSLAAVVAGQRIEPFWTLEYWALQETGFELLVEVEPAPGVPVKLIAVDQSFGLPQIPGFAFQPRPPYMTPRASPIADSLLVSRAYDFGE